MISPGVVLSAAEALRNGQQTFTRAQVAVLIHLAYVSGMRARYDGDAAELLCVWADHEEARPSYERRVAARIAEMVAGAERESRWQARYLRRHPLKPLDCDWPPVVEPPMGLEYVQQLRANEALSRLVRELGLLGDYIGHERRRR